MFGENFGIDPNDYLETGSHGSKFSNEDMKE